MLFFSEKNTASDISVATVPEGLFPKKGQKTLRIFTIPVLYRKAPVLSSIPRRKKSPENAEKTAGNSRFPHGFSEHFFSLDGNIKNLKEFGDYARKKGVEIGLWTQSDLHPKDGIEALLQRDIVKEVGTAGVKVLKTDVAWVGDGYSFGLNGVADVAQIMPYYSALIFP